MLTGLNFLKDLPTYATDKPYYFVEQFTELPQSLTTNCQYETKDVVLQDARGTESQFSLERNGWEYLKHGSKVSLDIEAYLGSHHSQDIVNEYLLECVQLIQARFKASRIICFDWRIRKSDATDDDVKTENKLKSRQSVQTPARTMHCDYSINGGYKRMATHLLPEEHKEVNQGLTRVRFVNLWRPLQTVEASPIVFGDPRTIAVSDLVEVDKVSRDSVEFGYRVRSPPRPEQRWYWLSRQGSDEPVIFVSWDPQVDGDHIGFPPHGAAMDIMENTTARPRASIEVRTMVLTPVEEGTDLSQSSQN